MSLLDKIIKFAFIIFFVSCSNAYAILEYTDAMKFRCWDRPELIYNVKSGQTWQEIEKKFSTPVKMLQRYNDSESLGKRIFIPARKLYIVKNGETALGIAVKHGMTLSELIILNNLNEPYAVKLNQDLKVVALKSKDKSIEKKPGVPVKLKFAWPIKGKVTSKFGMQENGTNNDGINIVSETNIDVKAAEHGEVVYSGNEVGNYGNLVIIQHPNEWFSSYGHLSKINVAKGDMIKSGQIIGNIEKLELYFSLRKNEKAVDPLKYLPQKRKKMNK